MPNEGPARLTHRDSTPDSFRYAGGLQCNRFDRTQTHPPCIAEAMFWDSLRKS